MRAYLKSSQKMRASVYFNDGLSAQHNCRNPLCFLTRDSTRSVSRIKHRPLPRERHTPATGCWLFEGRRSEHPETKASRPLAGRFRNGDLSGERSRKLASTSSTLPQQCCPLSAAASAAPTEGERGRDEVGQIQWHLHVCMRSGIPRDAANGCF